MYSLGRRLKAEAAKPRGRSPRGFAAEAFNLLPREYIEYSRKLPGAPFTMIPPRLSHRFSFFLPNALLYYVKLENVHLHFYIFLGDAIRMLTVKMLTVIMSTVDIFCYVET